MCRERGPKRPRIRPTGGGIDHGINHMMRYLCAARQGPQYKPFAEQGIPAGRPSPVTGAQGRMPPVCRYIRAGAREEGTGPGPGRCRSGTGSARVRRCPAPQGGQAQPCTPRTMQGSPTPPCTQEIGMIFRVLPSMAPVPREGSAGVERAVYHMMLYTARATRPAAA